MKLGIMQPYLFPYIGYIQLINSVDKFVVYDDVSFIKQGWINRNRILLNCRDLVFTVPLKNASSFVPINKTEINEQLYLSWKTKFLKTMVQAYSKAPFFEEIYALSDSVLNTPCSTISELAFAGLQHICAYLGMTTEFVPTSAVYNNNHLRSQERVIDICKKENADIYINPIGGLELYNKDEFRNAGLELYFVKSGKVNYTQFNCDFVSSLSVIDVLMFNGKEQVLQFANEYDLV